MRLLLIEDEPELNADLAKGLRMSGYLVDTALDGVIGLDKALDEEYDLIILDLNLPALSGMEVLNRIKKVKPEIRVLILTANSELPSKIEGFEAGASDYLTKPFHFKELEIRIRSLLHRRFIQTEPTLIYHGLSLDTTSRRVLVKGKELSCTAKETALLEYFLLHPNRLISQQELIDHVWDESVNIFSNSIRVHMSSLRKKLKSELGSDPIVTKIGEGYILQ